MAKAAGNDSERWFHRRKWLLLVVILSLTTSLVTRYAHVSSTETAATVKTNSPSDQPYRQRLHGNTFRWMATNELTTLTSLF